MRGRRYGLIFKKAVDRIEVRYISSPVIELLMQASMREKAKSDSGIAPGDLGSYPISSLVEDRRQKY